MAARTGQLMAAGHSLKSHNSAKPQQLAQVLLGQAPAGWRTVSVQLGLGRAVASVVLSGNAGEQPGGYAVHPAALDASTHTAAALAGGKGADLHANDFLAWRSMLAACRCFGAQDVLFWCGSAAFVVQCHQAHSAVTAPVLPMHVQQHTEACQTYGMRAQRHEHNPSMCTDSGMHEYMSCGHLSHPPDAGFPTRVPAALGAYLAPAAGLQATSGWAAASLDAPAADRSISAEFMLAGGARERAVNLQGFVAKVEPPVIATMACHDTSVNRFMP